MSTYRYCGTLTEVGELRLTKFGQVAEFSDAQAREVILGGGAIVPSADFDKIAFTEQELSLYSNSGSHGEANRAFQAKKKSALMACHDLRTRLEAGETISATPPIGITSEPVNAPAA